MHLFIMFLMAIAFVVLEVYLSKVALLQFEQGADDDVLKVKESYSQIIRKKDELAAEKADLQQKADRIFTLYELTREITRTFDEDDAFASFRDSLSRQIALQDCQLILDPPEDISEFPLYNDYRFFPLRSGRTILGELAYQGVAEKDEDTFAILAQQFALALKRIRLYKEVEDMAITDSLTRLNTRRHLMERFEEEFARARSHQASLSVLMIDVDHFKKVNDQYGHLTGDMVLREVGRIVRDQVREIDIAGRYGGEEISVVLPETDKQGAMLAAERIRGAIHEEKIRAYDASLHVTASTGVATFPGDAKKLDELLDKADWALYRAKKSGRDQVVGFNTYLHSPGDQ